MFGVINAFYIVATYSIGAGIVREKVSQHYNTSSADEHLQAAQFRREHPGLINNGEKCFENVFAAAKAAPVVEKSQVKVVSQKKQETLTDTGNNQRGCNKDKRSCSPSLANSKSRSHSNSNSNRSQALSYRLQSDKSSNPRNNSSENNFQSRNNNSRPSSNHSQSRSYRSRSRSNNSIRYSRSKSRSYRSQSGSNKPQSSRNHSDSSRKSLSIIRSCSKFSSSSVRRTYRDDSSRSQSSLRANNHLNSKRSYRSRSRTCSRSSRSCFSNLRTRQHIAPRHLKGSNHGTTKIDHKEMEKPQRRDTYPHRETLSAKKRDRQPSKDSRENNSSVSPRTRNRIRVEASYRLHQQQRLSNRSNVFRNIRPVSSSRSLSRQTDHQRHRTNDDSQEMLPLLKTLVEEVKEIRKIVNRNDRRFVENDRRLTRLEVTANKTIIVLGDVSNAINARMSLGNLLPREIQLPRGFHKPKLPINALKELVIINKDFKNDEFFNFLVSRVYYTFNTYTCLQNIFLGK